MALVGIYKPFEAISMVYCPTCFTLFKLNGEFEGYKHTTTTPVPGYSQCWSCRHNNGLTKEQIETYLKVKEHQKSRNK
jgi:hypothetical protein